MFRHIDADPDNPLQPLIAKYGRAAVWQASACKEGNGCPPTWQLCGSQVLKVAEVLSSDSFVFNEKDWFYGHVQEAH